MLVLDRVGKSFRNGWRRMPVPVLRGVHLRIGEGETLGLFGPSGGGKTTLARMIPGFIRPSTGKISFRGEDITRLPAKRMRAIRQKIQMIFQNPLLSLDPKQSVFNAIAEPLRVYGSLKSTSALREKVTALLSDCGLPAEISDRFPREISGGQAQRVALARALSINPELMIGDEMTSMLDVSVQAQIFRLLKRIQADRGLTLLLISHDLNLLRAVCDRTVVLEEGIIREVRCR